MRILALDLIAWGPFAGARLDFSAAPDALHVVYGENEAGKSTTLRAIRALLYGIDVRTVDAHRHDKGDLRIGGRLGGADGEVLEVVRRKGAKNTLLDAGGAPTDEAALRRLLGGVGPEQFSLLYGLDHESLRQGGAALLDAGGEIGASLYGAALGTVALGAALRRLKEEAAELWTPQAKDRPLTKALRELVDKQREAREAVKPPSHHQQLAEALREAEEREAAEHEALDKKRRERARVERLLHAAGLIARRRRATLERAALGEVPPLRPAIGAEREAAERALSAANAQAATLAARVGELADRVAASRVDEALLAAGPRLGPLREALDGARRAVAELPANRGRLGQLQREAEATRARLGVGVTARAPDAGVMARLRALATEAPNRARAVADRAAELSAVGARAEARLAERARIAPAPDAAVVSRVRAALAAVERAGELLSSRGRDLRERERLKRALARARAVLPAPLSSDGGVALEALLRRAPDEGQLEVCAQARAAAEEACTRASDAAQAAATRLAEATRALKLLVAARDVPTEEDLVRARGERDRAVERLAGLGDLGPLAGRALHDAIDAMRAAIGEADAIADRLRREARDVAEKARLVEEERLAGEAMTQLDERAWRARERLRDAEAAFAALFEPLGVPVPVTAGDARALLGRLREAAALEAQLRDVDDAIAHAVATEGELVGALAAALDAAAPARSPALAAAAQGGESLDALVARARLLLDGAAATERARLELERAIGDDAVALAEATARATAARRDERELLDAFGAELARLGLPSETPVAEAIETLSHLAGLAEREREARALADDLARDEQIVATLAAVVAPLVATLAPDLVGRRPEEAADALLRRHDEARAQATLRARVDEDLAAARAALARAEEHRAAAAARLAALCAEAGVPDAAALAECERRAERAAQLARELADLELQLTTVADSRSLDELEAEAGADDAAAALEARRRGLDDELEEAQRRYDDARGAVRDHRDQIELYANTVGAAELAAAAQEKVAEARAHLDRYVRLRTAAVILERQIERYRATHQGPILERASAIFSTLTRGNYSALRAELDDKDEVVLRALRPDGVRKDVAGLSDGSRDQLFLALRLATIESIAARHRPGADLPLVVDDIFVHFDDARSRAGLTVLGQLAARAQIILFTHHARLVELAREAVPPDRLVVHRLGAAPAAATG